MRKVRRNRVLHFIDRAQIAGLQSNSGVIRCVSRRDAGDRSLFVGNRVGEGEMVERAHVRCPVCRSVVPAMLLWAVGDACPRCHRALHVARRRRTPGGLFGNTLKLQAARSSADAGRAQDGR